MDGGIIGDIQMTANSMCMDCQGLGKIEELLETYR